MAVINNIRLHFLTIVKRTAWIWNSYIRKPINFDSPPAHGRKNPVLSGAETIDCMACNRANSSILYLRKIYIYATSVHKYENQHTDDKGILPFFVFMSVKKIPFWRCQREERSIPPPWFQSLVTALFLEKSHTLMYSKRLKYSSFIDFLFVDRLSAFSFVWDAIVWVGWLYLRSAVRLGESLSHSMCVWSWNWVTAIFDSCVTQRSKILPLSEGRGKYLTSAWLLHWHGYSLTTHGATATQG